MYLIQNVLKKCIKQNVLNKNIIIIILKKHNNNNNIKKTKCIKQNILKQMY